MRNSVIILAALASLSCASMFGADRDVDVRLHNTSSVVFDSVTVRFPDDVHRYGRLGPGELSAYANVSQAYRYAGIEAWIGGERYAMQPIDFVGEVMLTAGQHTYDISFDGNQLGLTLAGEPGDQHH